MKKVPIIGDLERGMDDTFKDIMGPLQAFYPLLKMGVILANPATAMTYAAYRSIPYCIDALKSKTAIQTYKKIGKATCKGMGNLGVRTMKLGAKYGEQAIQWGAKYGEQAIKLGAKYGKQAALSIGVIAATQSAKLGHYIKDKYNEYQAKKARDNSFDLDVDDDEFEFDDSGIEQESEFVSESAEYSDEIEVGNDEVEFSIAEVGDNCTFRFTRDAEGNIRQYITFNNKVSQAKIISESEYNKFYDNYTKTYGDKAEEKEKEIEKDVEYEM